MDSPRHCATAKTIHTHLFHVLLISPRLPHGRGSLLQFLGLPFGASAPVGVVDGGVLQQRREDEDEAHDEVNVDGFDVRDPRKRGPHAVADCRHRQNGGDAWRRRRETEIHKLMER